MESVLTIDSLPHGVVRIPPSKSISHRALICAALADGQSVIKNITLSKDVEATISCLRAMGMRYHYENEQLTIEKTIKTPFPDTLLDCGESGSTLRFLLPLALVLGSPLRFTGRGRLMQRPLKEYLELLTSKGGHFTTSNKIITAKGALQAGSFELPGDISSQFVTGLLLSLPLLKADSEIIMTSPLESKSYVDLTMDVMKSFGVNVENQDYRRFIVGGNQRYQPCQYEVESDFSAAAFFLVAGALGADVSCSGLNTNSLQGDREILEIIKNCGGQISQDNLGGLKATANQLNSLTVDVRHIPDLVPPIAVLLCFGNGESRITGAGRLRLKESNRLEAITTQLNSLGAKIVQEDDTLIIQGVKNLNGGNIDPQNDHRIAMAAAVAAIKSKNEVKIANPECVEKSYPNFWEDFCKQKRRENNE